MRDDTQARLDDIGRQLAEARARPEPLFCITPWPDKPDVKTWGYTVRWWPGRHSMSSGYKTPEEAREAALDFAKELGWTPRRWWQFWRWGDNP